METFFQSDSRIKSWLEQIIEKIFTVCLLKGNEAELAVEFTKGRQLVVKITMLLTDISSLPPSAVVDAIHQLLEQRLPDQRIIDKFPNFYQVMEDMIREGIASVTENSNSLFEQNIKSLDTTDNRKQHLLQKPASVIILAGGREPMLTPRSSGSYMTIPSNQENPTSTIRNLTVSEPVQQKLNIVGPLPLVEVGVSRLDKSENPEAIKTTKASMVKTPSEIDLCSQESLGVPVLAAVAAKTSGDNYQISSSLVDNNLTEIYDTISNSDQEIIVTNSLTTTRKRLNIPTEELKLSEIELQQNPSKDLPLSKNRVRSSSQVPTEATRLALVLQQIFPNTQARWNFKLGENNFLVQIKDLLIYLETISEGNRVEKEMKKEGWKIIVCNAEDLCYPRRLERAIQRVLKSSK